MVLPEFPFTSYIEKCGQQSLYILQMLKVQVRNRHKIFSFKIEVQPYEVAKRCNHELHTILSYKYTYRVIPNFLDSHASLYLLTFVCMSACLSACPQLKNSQCNLTYSATIWSEYLGDPVPSRQNVQVIKFENLPFCEYKYISSAKRPV